MDDPTHPDTAEVVAAAKTRWAWLPYLLLPAMLLGVVIWDLNRPERYEGGAAIGLRLTSGGDIELLPARDAALIESRIRSPKILEKSLARARLAKPTYASGQASPKWMKSSPWAKGYGLEYQFQLIGDDGQFIDLCSREFAHDLEEDFTTHPLVVSSGDLVRVSCYPVAQSRQQESSWIFRNLNSTLSWRSVRRDFSELVNRIKHPRRTP